jgi:hypothetical protein
MLSLSKKLEKRDSAFKSLTITSYQLCLLEQCLFGTSSVDQMFDNPSKIILYLTGCRQHVNEEICCKHA